MLDPNRADIHAWLIKPKSGPAVFVPIDLCESAKSIVLYSRGIGARLLPPAIAIEVEQENREKERQTEKTNKGIYQFRFQSITL